MATKNINLGTVPVSRGEFNSTTIYYKDNIVQYKRGSYQVVSESPIVGVPPINDEDIVNNGWIIFAGTLSEASLIKSNTQDLSGNNVQENLNSAAEKLKELKSEAVYDVSAHNNGATFESLSALLSSENLSTLIPTAVRCGGMSIRFVQSSDNKYVQYRLMANEWSIDTDDWAIIEEGVYVENPEFVYVKIDIEGKILWAIKADGSIYYGAGVPPQIIDYINEKIVELSLDEYEDIVAFLNRLEEGDKTLQTLLNEKVDKVEGKSLIDSEYASTKSIINNSEFLEVTTDSEDKILEGIREDGTKVIGGGLNVSGSAKIFGNMEVSGVSYKVIENPEYVAAWVDAEDKVIFGIKSDGKTYVGDADFLNDIDDIKNFLHNITDKNIDWDALSSITTVENSEYIEVKTDLEGKILAGRTHDGAIFENVGLSTPKLSIDGATIENIEDPEERTEVLTDKEGKIISYRDNDGVKHEEVGLCLSKNALNSFVNDIKKSNPFLSVTDLSDYISHDGDKPLILPKPNCARINIIAENFNISSLLKEGVPKSVQGVNYDVPVYIEFFDMEGNFFRKPIFISAQGQGSLYSAKKNLAIDLFDTEHGGDGLKIKFGDWIACDSFHLKGYYNDENKSRSVVAYQVYNDIVKTRGFFKDYVWKRGLIDEATITPTSTGLVDTDEYIDQMDNGARCFPDGFPIILYCNNNFYGLYVMLLKKDRANYKLSKKKANNLWLDTVIYDIWNMNGNLDWRIFSSTKIDTMVSLRGMEIRNPKDIYCVGFTYSYKILPDGGEKTAVINKPQYTSYDGDATSLTHEQIIEMNGGYPPAYLYNTETGIMYRIEQNPNGKYVKYNFDDPNKRSELIDESMSCYGKKKDGVTPLDPNNKDDAIMLANHKRSADVKKNMIALSKIYPNLQALDAAYEANKTSENLTAFKDKFEQYFDIDNLIDYQIICQLIYNWDSWGNNWLWFTYDGKKYFCGLYDCDASWGIGPGGTAILPIDSFIGQKMFVMMIKYYKERLVSRYKYLRDLKIIDRDSIMNKFLSFHHAWGSEYFEQEFKKWPQSTVKDSLGRIAKWIDANIANMDALYINN